MIIAACSKISIATLKKESDPKKRIDRRLDIGRSRHSQPETDLAALKKENRGYRCISVNDRKGL